MYLSLTLPYLSKLNQGLLKTIANIYYWLHVGTMLSALQTCFIWFSHKPCKIAIIIIPGLKWGKGHIKVRSLVSNRTNTWIQEASVLGHCRMLRTFTSTYRMLVIAPFAFGISLGSASFLLLSSIRFFHSFAFDLDSYFLLRLFELEALF